MITIQDARLFLLNTLTPVVKVIARTHAPWSVKDILEEDVYAAIGKMLPGMVFITRTNGAMTDLLIPGWWKHAAIVVDQHHVVEATAAGVTKSGIFNFLMRKDFAALLTPTFASPAQMAVAAVWSEAQVGAKYDYNFLPAEDYAVGTQVKDRAFYCAKLPWAAYRQACGADVPFTTRLTLGVQTVTPQDYANAVAVGKWTTTWLSTSMGASLSSQQPQIRA